MVNQRTLWPLYFLQFLPLLFWKPDTLQGALPIIVLIAAVYLLLGFALIRGQTWALTLSIFIQGMNVIVRLMMLFPNASLPPAEGGGLDWAYIVINVLAIALSIWLLLRLDKPDVRSTMLT
jgi:hypothetical protein